ncbi:MFS general substrate transporter [Coniophora puteana RWD-64-598 SS2]|uniref:MFS general substrate transporter n=1 Tax=Coniophora puteana (strain RWD-64-598) TaxID=741705 RepID=A0A5M3MWQ9_CONPW|nr:MFS general substrate transporter [Coniophora puteana RWD-64-598 SS2]EIW83579.1 MFS general substrate transporter [Coniophora puteana RWD-64-598 SS2]
MAFTARDLLVLCALCGVNTLNLFLSGALTVAVPTIGKDLGFAEDALQWPVNVNALAFACLLLFFGRLGDIYGCKLVFLAGTAFFGVWSIATAVAPNEISFIVFIALEGVGSACNTPASIGIISAYFPPGKKRNIAYGALGAAKPAGYIFGLVLGGVLTQSKATWRSIFYIQAGFSFLFFALGAIVFPKEDGSRRYAKGLDWIGALLSTVSLAMFTYSISDSTATSKGWRAPQVPTLFSVSIVMMIAWVFWERRREARGESVLVPMSIWTPGSKKGRVLLVVFFGWWCFNTLVYFCTLVFQQIQLLDPLDTAIRFIPLVVSAFIINVITGALMGHVNGQILIVCGLILGTGAPLIFALLNVDLTYWAMLFPVLVLICGIDIAFPVGNLHVASTFDEDSQNLAGGVFNVANQLGISTGLAVSSAVAAAVSKKYSESHPDLSPTSPEVLMPGFRAAGWTCFAAVVIALLIAVFGLRGIVPVEQIAQQRDRETLVDMQEQAAKKSPTTDRFLRPAPSNLSMAPSTLPDIEPEVGAGSSHLSATDARPVRQMKSDATLVANFNAHHSTEPSVPESSPV